LSSSRRAGDYASGLILLGLPFFYQLVATGFVLVLAIAANEALRRIT
jgi:ribose/xylose/arabinose/galactoside ABC-type transport system permease subunit